MIKINLLPHREEKRKLRKKAFITLMVGSAIVAGAIVLTVGGVIANKISDQNQRNTFIKAENSRLDLQIKEVATLKADIDALKARQQAVEDLQGDRNQPVYLMDELVQQVPEGVYLRAFKQEGQRVVLNGYAQSNERVAELLRNLSASPWLERPDLIEIRSTSLGQGKDAKKVFDFTVNVGIKRPRDKDKAQVSAPGVNAPASAGANAAANPVPASVPKNP